MSQGARRSASRAAAVGLAVVALAFLPQRLLGDRPGADVDPTAGLVAQGFVVALLGGDLATAEGLAAAPFSFDGQVAADAGALHARLSDLIESGHLRGRRFLRIETLPAEQAVARFGPPPGRLHDLVGHGTVVALVRLNRSGMALFVRRAGTFWRVVGVTD